MFHLYIIKGCPFCENSISLLDSFNLNYTLNVVAPGDKEKFRELNNNCTFPQIFFEPAGSDGKKKSKNGNRKNGNRNSINDKKNSKTGKKNGKNGKNSCKNGKCIKKGGNTERNKVVYIGSPKKIKNDTKKMVFIGGYTELRRFINICEIIRTEKLISIISEVVDLMNQTELPERCK